MLQANQVCFSNLYLRNSKDSEYFFHNEVFAIIMMSPWKLPIRTHLNKIHNYNSKRFCGNPLKSNNN